MKQHDAFIEKYKELEKILDVQVRDYEETLPDESSQKLRLCRMIRNYIQHNSDYEKFISISPGMQSYLDNTVNEIHQKSGILKDHITSPAKYGFVSELDNISDAASLMLKKKRSFNIVLNKNGEYLGILTKEIISDCFGDRNITKSTKISKIVDLLKTPLIPILSQSTPMDKVNEILEKEKIIIAVNNSNKITGIILKD